MNDYTDVILKTYFHYVQNHNILLFISKNMKVYKLLVKKIMIACNQTKNLIMELIGGKAYNIDNYGLLQVEWLQTSTIQQP